MTVETRRSAASTTPMLMELLQSQSEEGVSQAEVAFRRLLRAIATGKIPRNVIVKESRLARDLDIARGAVREAVSRLEGLQILERRANLGIFVYDFVASDLSEILTVREALEGMSARIAATTITNEDLDRLEHVLDRATRMAEEGTFESRYDDDFHFIIARATGNRRLIQLVCDDVQFQLRLAWHRTVTHPIRLQASMQEHRLIFEALGARDPQRAEEAMRRHIANGRNYALSVSGTERRQAPPS